jgi:hypothetical protein
VWSNILNPEGGVEWWAIVTSIAMVGD